ncbi:MAG: hydrogenase maturation nickel metallochaperone HypA [Magnetococcales bacterium]|nr:hydrogenase maturation nickel metallochaperone HypA [Magnetococcales bacterium]
MHELSLATALVEQLQEIMAREGVQELVSVTVAMGVLSGVEREALEFCFPLVVEATPLKGAILKIVETPLCFRCPRCLREWQAEKVDFAPCGGCGSAPEIIDGRDLVIRSLEVT